MWLLRPLASVAGHKNRVASPLARSAEVIQFQWKEHHTVCLNNVSGQRPRIYHSEMFVDAVLGRRRASGLVSSCCCRGNWTECELADRCMLIGRRGPLVYGQNWSWIQFTFNTEGLLIFFFLTMWNSANFNNPSPSEKKEYSETNRTCKYELFSFSLWMSAESSNF